MQNSESLKQHRLNQLIGQQREKAASQATSHNPQRHNNTDGAAAHTKAQVCHRHKLDNLQDDAGSCREPQHPPNPPPKTLTTRKMDTDNTGDYSGYVGLRLDVFYYKLQLDQKSDQSSKEKRKTYLHM